MASHYHQWNSSLGRWIKFTPDVKPDITRNYHSKPQYVFGKPRETRAHVAGERTSTYTGVTYRPQCARPWQSRIKIGGIMCLLGYYSTEREAAIAYDKKAIPLGRKTNILQAI